MKYEIVENRPYEEHFDWLVRETGKPVMVVAGFEDRRHAEVLCDWLNGEMAVTRRRVGIDYLRDNGLDYSIGEPSEKQLARIHEEMNEA
jgi:hypothetical protein